MKCVQLSGKQGHKCLFFFNNSLKLEGGQLYRWVTLPQSCCR